MEENNYTIEQMRLEYQAMKDALAKQEIVNDRLMREAMKTKVRGIRTAPIISAICAVFVLLSAPFIFHYNPVVNASWWFVGFTEVMMVACVWLDWKFNHKVQSTDLNSCDLLTFVKSVKKLKSDYKNWIKYGLVLAVIWCGWLCLEVWFHASNPKLAAGLIIGMVFGLILGGILGYSLDKRVINYCDEIISQIEE